MCLNTYPFLLNAENSNHLFFFLTAREWSKGVMGGDCWWIHGFSFGVLKSAGIRDDGCIACQVLKPTQLCALNGEFYAVSYISIKT